MKRNLASLVVSAALAVPGAAGQPLSGPTQGMTYDAPSRSLRPVLGSFGSATLGPAILSDVEFATMAPLQQRGIACRGVECFAFTGQALELQAVPEQREMPEGSAWSASGDTVVLYSRTGEWIRVFEAGEWSAQLSTHSLGGQVMAAAVSPDGAHKVFAIAGEHSGVFELAGLDAFVPLLAAEQPRALAYSVKGDTLYVLGRDHVDQLRANGTVESWALAVEEPWDIQPSRDASGRSVVYVAGRGDHALFTYDAASHGLLETIPLAFAPSRIEPYGAGSFLLTARASEEDLLWSYTSGRGAFFVPVTPVEADTTQRKVRR
jgi:hypothetical protein